jgi:hypothetical protein
MPVKIDQWEISEEQLRLLIAGQEALLDKLERECEFWHNNWRDIDITNPPENISAGLIEKLMAYYEAELLLAALRMRLPESRAEQEILDALSKIEIPPDESVTKLNNHTAAEWRQIFNERRDRRSRLVKINAPNLIVMNEMALLLEAGAGCSWMQARELRAEIEQHKTSLDSALEKLEGYEEDPDGE